MAKSSPAIVMQDDREMRVQTEEVIKGLLDRLYSHRNELVRHFDAGRKKEATETIYRIRVIVHQLEPLLHQFNSGHGKPEATH